MTPAAGIASPEKQGSSPSPKLIAAVVILALALIFVLQNTTSGKVNFLFWDVSAPAWVWLLTLFAAGVIVGSIFPWLRKKKKPPAAPSPPTPSRSRPPETPPPASPA